MMLLHNRGVTDGRLTTRQNLWFGFGRKTEIAERSWKKLDMLHFKNMDPYLTAPDVWTRNTAEIMAGRLRFVFT